MSNSLGPDQNQNSVGPDLGPVCKSYRQTAVTTSKERVMSELILFDLIHYAPSTIFLLCRDGSSWVEPVLS